MTDYTELATALRIVEKEQDCNECDAGRWHHDFNCCLFADAADAIEELNKNWKYCSDMLNLALKVSGLSMTALVKLYETEAQE